MIAGAGFAMMAWELAKLHALPNLLQLGALPVDRDFPFKAPADIEYHRILDRAAEHWRQRCGTFGCFCMQVRL